jgi:hypothetical protein
MKAFSQNSARIFAEIFNKTAKTTKFAIIVKAFQELFNSKLKSLVWFFFEAKLFVTKLNQS